MKIFGIICAYIFTIGLVMTGIHCWEDHPDIVDHRETDRLLKLANEQTGYNEYERQELERQSQEDLKNYKRSKFWKAKDVKNSK